MMSVRTKAALEPAKGRGVRLSWHRDCALPGDARARGYTRSLEVRRAKATKLAEALRVVNGGE